MRNRKGKWQPFDALGGYREALEEVKHQKGKQSKPVLSNEYLEELNEKLTLAINDETEVCLKYYQDGYVHTIYGIITKVDVVYKVITINNKKININSITELIV